MKHVDSYAVYDFIDWTKVVTGHCFEWLTLCSIPNSHHDSSGQSQLKECSVATNVSGKPHKRIVNLFIGKPSSFLVWVRIWLEVSTMEVPMIRGLTPTRHRQKETQLDTNSPQTQGNTLVPHPRPCYLLMYLTFEKCWNVNILNTQFRFNFLVRHLPQVSCIVDTLWHVAA